MDRRRLGAAGAAEAVLDVTVTKRGHHRTPQRGVVWRAEAKLLDAKALEGSRRGRA
jgi:hypothetical protein